MKKTKCTETTIGKIKNLKNKGLESTTLITVEYQVEGIYYIITESVKLKSRMIKLGFLPIGQKKVPVMGDISVGRPAMVNYDPSDPSKAFITKNIGKITG